MEAGFRRKKSSSLDMSIFDCSVRKDCVPLFLFRITFIFTFFVSAHFGFWIQIIVPC